MNHPFQKSSEYYDALYQSKNYAAESDYIFSLIKPYLKKTGGELLDIGCGTGNYFKSFSERNYQITGFDISAEMVSIAKSRYSKYKYIIGDISQTEIESKYELVTMLFHVINYQSSTNALLSTLLNVKKCLKPDSLFVFDFWNGHAILKDPPKTVEKKIAYQDFEIFRTTIPDLQIKNQIINVNFKYKIKKKNSIITEFDELHVMRYLFLEEIETLINKVDLKIKESKAWLKMTNVTDDDWYGIIVAGF